MQEMMMMMTKLELDPVVVVGSPEICGTRDMTDEASQNSCNDETDSQSTIALSNPSQKCPEDFEPSLSEQRIPPRMEEKEVQTDECFVLSKEEYEDLLKKAYQVIQIVKKTLKN